MPDPVNLDEIDEPGVYRIATSTATNFPIVDRGWIEVTKTPDGWVTTHFPETN